MEEKRLKTAHNHTQMPALGLATNPFPKEPLAADREWKCDCGTLNKGKFCSQCGSPFTEKK